MSGETWAKIFASAETPEALIAAGEVTVSGDAAEAARLIDLFDRYVPETAVVVPSAALFHDY